MTTVVQGETLGPPATRPRAAPSARWLGLSVTIVVAAVWLASFAIGFRAALAALTAIGFLLTAVGVVRPAAGLLGIGLLSTLDTVSRALLFTGGIWRFNTLNYWLVAVCLLFVRGLLSRRDTQTRLLQGFMGILGVGLLVTPDIMAGLQQILNALSAFGVLVYCLKADRRPDAWYWAAVVCGVAAGLGGIAYNVEFAGLPAMNPNAYALFPATALFAICLGFRFARGRWVNQLPLIGLAAVNLVWIFLSGSRGGMLIGVCCLLYLIVESRGWLGSLVMLGFSGAIAIGLVTQFPTLQGYALHRVTRLIDPSASYASRSSGRTDLALGGWYIFRDSPLGVGTGGYDRNWAELTALGRAGYGRGKERPAHSAWVKTLAENGIPGVLLLAAYVGSFVFSGWRTRRRNRFLVGGLATIVLGVAFLSTEFQARGLWFLAGGATALIHRRKEGRPAPLGN